MFWNIRHAANNMVLQLFNLISSKHITLWNIPRHACGLCACIYFIGWSTFIEIDEITSWLVKKDPTFHSFERFSPEVTYDPLFKPFLLRIKLRSFSRASFASWNHNQKKTPLLYYIAMLYNVIYIKHCIPHF